MDRSPSYCRESNPRSMKHRVDAATTLGIVFLSKEKKQIISAQRCCCWWCDKGLMAHGPFRISWSQRLLDFWAETFHVVWCKRLFFSALFFPFTSDWNSFFHWPCYSVSEILYIAEVILQLQFLGLSLKICMRILRTTVITTLDLFPRRFPARFGCEPPAQTLVWRLWGNIDTRCGASRPNGDSLPAGLVCFPLITSM